MGVALSFLLGPGLRALRFQAGTLHGALMKNKRGSSALHADWGSSLNWGPFSGPSCDGCRAILGDLKILTTQFESSLKSLRTSKGNPRT